MRDTGWIANRDETIQISACYENLWSGIDYEFPTGPGTTKCLVWLTAVDIATGEYIKCNDEYNAVLIGLWADIDSLKYKGK